LHRRCGSHARLAPTQKTSWPYSRAAGRKWTGCGRRSTIPPAPVEQFADAEVAAVAENVKVGNEDKVLSRRQSIEYITSQNFDRRAFDLLNCITVVPGAIGAFLFERERLSRLWLLIPQRFVYRQLIYWVLIKSTFRR
jgi:hypothetical protein